VKKVILTDVDGVVLQWLESFEPWMTQRGCPRRSNSDHEWNIAKRHHNITYEQAMACVHEFNHSDEVRHLKPYGDSVKYIRKLANKGFEFIAVTSLSDNSTAGMNRCWNLREIFGNVFTEVHCLKVGESKQQILSDKWGGTGYLWIEDHFKNAEAGYEVGLSPLLVDTAHNREFETKLFPRISEHKPWEEIYTLAMTHYQVDK